MYREMDENGQMNIDVRLESERDLEENVNVLLEFAHEQVVRESRDTTKNRFEGFGLLSEKMIALHSAVKQIGNDMATFQKTLPVDDVRALDAVGAIDNTLAEVVLAAVSMSAMAKKVADDLYDLCPRVTPIEEYAEKLDGGDGFQDAEEMAQDGHTGTPEEKTEDKPKKKKKSNVVDISKAEL